MSEGDAFVQRCVKTRLQSDLDILPHRAASRAEIHRLNLDAAGMPASEPNQSFRKCGF